MGFGGILPAYEVTYVVADGYGHLRLHTRLDVSYPVTYELTYILANVDGHIRLHTRLDVRALMLVHFCASALGLR